jgi:hypothetical protein
MQIEAGEGLLRIIWRKELERRASDAVFFWGVGNAPSRYTQGLAAAGVTIPVVFSIMKSRPKLQDVAPPAILIWRSYVDHTGRNRALPDGALVTSRYKHGDRPRHYALMCRSDQPLDLSNSGSFDPTAYRNLGNNGSQIASSQVTTLAVKVSKEREGSPYRRGMLAQLFGSYWVKLADPLLIVRNRLELMLERWPEKNMTPDNWLDVSQIKIGEGLADGSESDLPLLRALN